MEATAKVKEREGKECCWAIRPSPKTHVYPHVYTQVYTHVGCDAAREEREARVDVAAERHGAWQQLWRRPIQRPIATFRRKM